MRVRNQSALVHLTQKGRIVILSLQQPSGVFAGDRYGELDTRFLYCAVQALSLLGRLHELDVDRTVGYIQKCKNFDGGFGAVIGAESHAAMGASPALFAPARLLTIVAVFVCTAALAILDRLDVIDQETLAWWLAERQLPNGGLNGRPEKLEDARCPHILSRKFVLTLSKVCYSFWVLSALAILKKVSWIDSDKLISFILSAQVRPSAFLVFVALNLA